MKRIILLITISIALIVWSPKPAMAEYIAWADTIDNGSIDHAYGVATDVAGNIIVTGGSNISGSYKYFTVKYDPDGNILWTDTINTAPILCSRGLGVATDGAGNIIVTGLYKLTGGNADYLTVKYDPDGNILWTDIIDNGGADEAYGVATDGSDNIIVTGYSHIAGDDDYYTVKYDPDGNILWADTIDNGDYDYAYEVATDGSDNIIVTGYSLIGGWDNYFTVKYDPDGNILWTDALHIEWFDYAQAVATDGSDNIIVTGWQDTYSGTRGRDYLTVKYDPDGNILWTDIIDNGGADYAQAVATDGSDNIIVTGYSSIAGDDDYYTVKYDPDGNVLWADTIDNGWHDRAWGVATYGAGNIIVTGYSYIAGNYDYFTVKYVLPTLMTVSVPDTTYGAPGDTISIPIMVSDLTGLGVVSAEFTLNYDSTIINGIDIDTSATLLSGTDWTWQFNAADDSVHVFIAGTDTLTGSGTLINLIFVVSPDAQPGQESPLHFVDFLFNEGTPAVTTQDGVFIVRTFAGAIEGTVTDAATGNPIAGAVVTAYNTHTYCDTTDDAGYYLIITMAEIIPDTCDMTVTAFGYNQFDIMDIIVLPGDTTEVNFSMLHPEIVVEPANFDIELPVDTTYDATMTISNPGNGPLDFDINISINASRLVNSIESIPDGFSPIQQNKIDNSYGELAVSLISETPIRGAQPKPTYEDTIHYDGENYYAVGIIGGGAFEGAIKLTPTELGPYDGWTLTSVLFYYSTGSCTGTVKIYEGGLNPSQPGALITSEPYSVSEQNWWRIDLSSPVTIIASHDMWVSLTASNSAGEYPLGADSGPAVDGKGDWIYYDDSWTELQDLGLDFNWNIRAIVISPWLSVTPDSGTVPDGQSLDINVQFYTYGLTPDSTYAATIRIHNNSDDSLVTIPVTMHVITVGVEDDAPQIPKVFALSQNYPNPASGITSISYQLPRKSKVSIKLYDVRGRFVKTLVEGTREPGFHSVTWNTCDNNGKKLASGIYFYRLSARGGSFSGGKADSYVETKKLLLLR